MIYSNKAIDYSVGTDIYDVVNGKFYSDSEAKQQPKEIRSRLTLKPRKIGCYVLSLEEVKKIMRAKK